MSDVDTFPWDGATAADLAPHTPDDYAARTAMEELADGARAVLAAHPSPLDFVLKGAPQGTVIRAARDRADQVMARRSPRMAPPPAYDPLERVPTGRAMPAAGSPDPEEPFTRSWQPLDLTTVLDGTYEPLVPTVGRRSDGTCLFYAGRTHTITGEPEGGKSWFALSACQDEMNAGNHVAYLDFEDNEGGIVGRLRVLGCSPDVIRERFHYVRPTGPIGTGINLDDLRSMLDEYQPTLAITDGVTEAMAMHGLDPNKNDETAKFGKLLAKVVIESGITAAVDLDHVTKDREGRGRWAIGAQHKMAGLTGAAYSLENRTPFGIGIKGKTTIRIAKDRPGQLRKAALPGKGMFWFGDLVLDSHGEDFAEVSIEPPHERAEDSRPTVVMEHLAEILAEHGELSQRKLLAIAKGNKDNAVAALTFLQVDGYVSEETPHKLLKPYPSEDPE